MINRIKGRKLWKVYHNWVVYQKTRLHSLLEERKSFGENRKLLFLEETPAVLWQTLWGSMVFVPLEQRSKSTSHPKRQENWLQFYYLPSYFVIIFITGFCIWCQQIFRNFSTRKKWKYEWRASERPAAWIHKPKTKFKWGAKKYRSIFRMNCMIGYRNSERSWLMKVLQKSFGETLSKEVKTLPVRLINLQWSREHTWNQVRASKVFSRFAKDPNCDICLKTKNNKGFLQKAYWTVVRHSGKFWWLDHSGSQNSKCRKWIAK